MISPEGVGERGPSGQYKLMPIGNDEKALVWIGPPSPSKSSSSAASLSPSN